MVQLVNEEMDLAFSKFGEVKQAKYPGLSLSVLPSEHKSHQSGK